MSRLAAPLCLPVFALLAVAAAGADDATRAGRFVIEHPTLHNLGFEWAIEGDANRNAEVTVEYRKAGERAWREALPLVRIGGERVFREREHLDYTVPHGFAGSIFGLEEGTEYECRFALTDPDGAEGKTDYLVRVKTRSEPRPYAGGRTLHVYPPAWEGPKEEPNFTRRLARLLRLRPRRLERGVGAPRAARRHDLDARRPLQEQPPRLRRRDDDALRRHDVADAQRHARQADYDQGRRRRPRLFSTATATTAFSM